MRKDWLVPAAAAVVVPASLVLVLTSWPLAVAQPPATGPATGDRSGEEVSRMGVVGAGPVTSGPEDVVPGRIIVETADPSVAVDDPDLLAAVDQAHSAHGEAVPADSGGLLVSFGGLDGGPLPPIGVRSVVADAVAEWDKALDLHPSGPVVVGVRWGDLGDKRVIGTAGPQSLVKLGEGSDVTYYPVALANTMTGSDHNGPAVPELIVGLNSGVDWHLGVGTGAGPEPGQVDLYTVALHEIAHGLGFVGSARCPKNAFDACTGEPALNDPPSAYDRLVHAGEEPLVSLGDTHAHLTDGELEVHTSEGTSYQVYAPPEWRDGLSFSHLDEDAFPPGSCGALMTPTIRPAETVRGLDAETLGVMAAIGWPMGPPPPPQSVDVTTSGLTATVSWAAPYCAGDTTYTVERSTGGSEWTSLGATSALSLAAEVPVGTHVFRVQATDSRGPGEYAQTEPVDLSGALVRPVALDGQVSRIFQAWFGREPDPAEFASWTEQRASGESLLAISEALATSDELSATTRRLTDTQFVDRAYEHVLGRPADDQSRAYWVDQLDRGRSRGSVMIAFSESPEFVARTGTAAPTTSITGEIRRLYAAFFRREPDEVGLAHWTAARSEGVPLDRIAREFAESPEFAATYGSVSDSRFLELAYANVLGRAPDAEGVAHWEEQLASGTDRGSVMAALSQSPELILTTGTLP